METCEFITTIWTGLTRIRSWSQAKNVRRLKSLTNCWMFTLTPTWPSCSPLSTNHVLPLKIELRFCPHLLTMKVKLIFINGYLGFTYSITLLSWEGTFRLLGILSSLHRRDTQIAFHNYILTKHTSHFNLRDKVFGST